MNHKKRGRTPYAIELNWFRYQDISYPKESLVLIASPRVLHFVWKFLNTTWNEEIYTPSGTDSCAFQDPSFFANSCTFVFGDCFWSSTDITRESHFSVLAFDWLLFQVALWILRRVFWFIYTRSAIKCPTSCLKWMKCGVKFRRWLCHDFGISCRLTRNTWYDIALYENLCYILCHNYFDITTNDPSHFPCHVALFIW